MLGFFFGYPLRVSLIVPEHLEIFKYIPSRFLLSILSPSVLLYHTPVWL
jgi:hypothetical protein